MFVVPKQNNITNSVEAVLPNLLFRSTVRVGNFEGEECFVPFNKLVPMVNPDDIELGGWDISGYEVLQYQARWQRSRNVSAVEIAVVD